MKTRYIPSLNWLRVFEAAARLGGFAQAAAELNMTAPAVSKQIKSLEAHLRQPLFARGAHSVELTRAGRAFVPAVREGLAALETGAASIFGDRPLRTLDVQAPAIFAMSWLAERTGAFEEAHPRIRLQISASVAGKRIPGGAADLRIVYEPAAGGAPNDLLFGEDLHPVAAPELAARIRKAKDLLGHTLIETGVDRSGWLAYLRAFAPDDVARARFRICDSTPVALALAAAGRGVALARAPASDFLARKLGLIRCAGKGSVASAHAYFLVGAARARQSDEAALFRRWLLGQTGR
jgi:LysR family transcriptional regulator, glycine cleavage system transcriptional activator